MKYCVYVDTYVMCVLDLPLKEQQSHGHSPWRKLFGLRKATQKAHVCASVCPGSAK